MPLERSPDGGVGTHDALDILDVIGFAMDGCSCTARDLINNPDDVRGLAYFVGEGVDQQSKVLDALGG
ncbi:MAG: hypothetical protein ACRDJW_24490 [Thermomicrobiales bacterium]